MRALTLHQPWASLIALGIKTIETRSWSTSYRGPLAIHAGKSVEYEGWKVGDWKWESGIDGQLRRTTGAAHGIGVEVHPLPLGAVVATCTLVDVVPIVDVIGAEHQRGSCVEIGLKHEYLGLWQPGAPVLRRIDDQRPYGDFSPGRYAWLLADVEALPEPVPAKGRQGLWEWDAVAIDEAREVSAQNRRHVVRHSYSVTADDRVAVEVAVLRDPDCRFAKASEAHLCSRRDGADLEPGMPCYREAFEQVREAGQTLREAEIAADGGIDEPGVSDLCRPPYVATDYGPVYRLIDLADPRET